ncbi:MAG: hypothetical protein P1U37_14230 [Minwuia sp.]|nr:hypothetical protein [Minwuia sp.]
MIGAASITSQDTAMASISSIVRKHVDAAVAEAAETGYSREDVARSMLSFVTNIYKETRSPDEIASELRHEIENLDPDAEHAFMRP